eukprot:CAMPEP_0118934040 /NCGR_PEP_ID=MMETSP1169-20130426/13442_1 /TAXON_ID=36882 /ORGANISM="Pyramimonas obovata, Strain CCMP722" /LENGTH=306 /DNA_ID=CAMNT_0006876901 /DNA_START=230 /DNA_END=1149 /DNA_ORIENTATION=+
MLLAGATPGLVRPAGCSQLPRRCSLVSHVPQRVATRCSKFRVNAYQTSASDFVNASAVEDYRTMQVQPGDGALKIARIHSISMAELVALNPSTDMSALEVGPPPASGLTSANASRMLVPQPPSEDLALDLQSSVAGAVAHFKVYLTKASSEDSSDDHRNDGTRSCTGRHHKVFLWEPAALGGRGCHHGTACVDGGQAPSWLASTRRARFPRPASSCADPTSVAPEALYALPPKPPISFSSSRCQPPHRLTSQRLVRGGQRAVWPTLLVVSATQLKDNEAHHPVTNSHRAATNSAHGIIITPSVAQR